MNQSRKSDSPGKIGALVELHERILCIFEKRDEFRVADMVEDHYLFWHQQIVRDECIDKKVDMKSLFLEEIERTAIRDIQKIVAYCHIFATELPGTRILRTRIDSF